MSREIKFRAINKDGEFIYGLPYTDGVNETAYYEEYNNRMCWRREDGANCNQPYKNGTLQQYINIKDTHGEEYYEGDIGRFDNGDTFVLKMEDWLEVYVEWIGEPECEDQARDLYRIVAATIIGNTHKNPELMEP